MQRSVLRDVLRIPRKGVSPEEDGEAGARVSEDGLVINMGPEKETSSHARSSWLLGVFGILALWFVLVHKMSKKNKQKPQHGNTADDHHPPSEHCRFEPPSIYPVRIEATAGDNQWKADQKGYWGQQINSQKWLNRITAAGVVIAFIYAFLTLLLWLKAKEALTLQQRPWIGVSAAASNYVAYEMPGKNLVIHGVVRLKNFGQSPALLVYPLAVPTPSTATLDEQMSKNCETAKDRLERTSESGIPKAQPIEGETIFPGQEVDWPFIGSADAIEPMPQSPMLAGCIYYRDQWRNERHTQFCYYLPYTSVNEQLRSCPLDNAAY